jgi:predicted HAD superfamily phosphohydrolase YqeG
MATSVAMGTTVATPAITMATPATSTVVIGTPATTVVIGSLTAPIYGIFVEALKAGLELKQKFPHSRIKVHDAEYDRI